MPPLYYYIPMIVSFETVEIPEIDSYSDIENHLKRIADDQIPAFVMHNAGASFRDVVDNVRQNVQDPSFDEVIDYYGLTIEMEKRRWYHRFTRSNIGASAFYHDFGLHLDRAKVRDGSGVTTISLHLTESGAAEATLFEPTDEFLELGAREIPPNVRALFEVGKTDDEILHALGHITSLGRGSLLAFRLGGNVPVAHQFRTTKLPRKSQVTNIYHHL
jgi:hypothetical protein